MWVVLAVVLIILMLGGLPNVSGHSYGYFPSGIGLVILIVLVVLLLSGRL